MRKKSKLIFPSLLLIMILLSHSSMGQNIYTTKFEHEQSWSGGTMTGYNEKLYEHGGWRFHSTEAVRGTADESYSGSPYSFRDRGVFTVKNLEAVSNMEGFIMQLRDWMIGDGEQRNINLSTDGGNNWTTIAVINKDWFDAYQTYQEFVYYFNTKNQNFDAEELIVEIDGGGGSNDGRINIGQFVALGIATQVATPTITPASGLYYNDISVNISTITQDATLYYSMESDQGPWVVFSEPLTISPTLTVADVYSYGEKEGLDDSEVAHNQYTFETMYLHKDFEDGDLLSGGWAVYDFKDGANSWGIAEFGGIKFAMITEYQSDPALPHSWYISPPVDLSSKNSDEIVLTFDSKAAHRTGDALSVNISTDYSGSGNPTSATWTTLDAQFDTHTGSGFGSWTNSGNIDLSDYDGTIYIAFQYESDSDNLGRWEINDIMIKEPDEDDASTVENIAELRSGTVGETYILTGEAIVSFTQSYRNQKYIQDETGAIMIDDPGDGVISEDYQIGDGIKNLKGTLDEYAGMLQFVPVEDPGEPNSTGNTIEPEEKTLDAITADDQAKLLLINNVDFQSTGTFDVGTVYDISDPSGTGVFRTNFYDVDYIGESIPTETINLIALVTQHGEVFQLTARSSEDLKDDDDTQIDNIEDMALTAYPNPFSNNLYLKNTENVKHIVIINSMGQIKETLKVDGNEITINTSGYKTGIYFIRMIMNDGSQISKKLIKQ